MTTTHPAATEDWRVAAPRIPSRRRIENRLIWSFAGLVDEMIVCYVNWREYANAVEDAYRRWSDAPRDEVPGLHSAYIAALDQEECAAIGYALAVGELERTLQRGGDQCSSSRTDEQ